jgi:hypothetical protein
LRFKPRDPSREILNSCAQSRDLVIRQVQTVTSSRSVTP